MCMHCETPADVLSIDSAGSKGKVESILARLGRLKVKGGTVDDEDESKWRRILFEWVLSVDYHCPH
jgi:hypothetical protein